MDLIMKKYFAVLLAALLLVVMVPTRALADETVKLTIINNGDFTEKSYPIGTKVTLDPGKDPAGFIFSHWENEDKTVLSSDRNYTITLTKDMEISAEYDVNVVEAGDAVWDYATGELIHGKAPAGVRYDAKAHILFLNNATVKSRKVSDGVSLSAISSCGSLTIDISGDNTVSGPCFGIEMQNNAKVTIVGSGTLTCYAEQVDERYGSYAFGRVVDAVGDFRPIAVIPQVPAGAVGYVGKDRADAEENGPYSAARFMKEFDEAGFTSAVWARIELGRGVVPPINDADEPIPETGDGMGLFVFAGLALISMLGMVAMKKREA